MKNKYTKVINENGEFLKEKEIINSKDIIPTQVEIQKHETAVKYGKDIYDYAKIKIVELKLEMQLINFEINLNKNYIILNFLSKNRIDFRELVKLITSKFKIRLELHQIGVRDRSTEIGGVGKCGQELCCARFLDKKDNINIGMAKKQNLALNPERINGVCGRLLCCLRYEMDNYSKKENCNGCKK